MLADLKKRIKIIHDVNSTCEERVFAGLELLCAPLSWLTLLLIPFLLLNRWILNTALPEWMNCCFTILLAAAIGYVTNFIAIEMLFKPYRKARHHPLSLFTFGYWSQGLIPRNKNKIGKQLGEEAETLVPPAKIAEDLCLMVTGLFRNEDGGKIETILSAVRNLLHSKEEEIVRTCRPLIEVKCEQKVNEIITGARLKTIWDDMIKPKLVAFETKGVIVQQLVRYIENKLPSVMPTLKEEIREIIYCFLKQNEWVQLLASVGLVDNVERKLTDYIIDDAIDWNEISFKIYQRIGSDAMRTQLFTEIEKGIDKIEQWINSDAGIDKLCQIADSVRERLMCYLKEWLQCDFGTFVKGAICSGGTWEYVQKKLIPAIVPALEAWLKGDGKNLVLAKLDLSDRIASAVDRLSVEDFHERVNGIAAQHLGAIQILGYFLGLFAGLGMYFC